MRMFPLFLILVLVLMAGSALAANQSDGSLGLSLTQGMYCDMKGLFSSNIGKIVGLLVALMGLLKIIQGSTGMGIAFIMGGAAVTMLPSLIESFLGGVGAAVGGFSNRSTIQAPDC